MDWHEGVGRVKTFASGWTTRCMNMTTALTDMSIQFEVLAVNVEVEALRNIHKLQVDHSAATLHVADVEGSGEFSDVFVGSCANGEWWRSRDISMHSIIKASLTRATPAQTWTALTRTQYTLSFFVIINHNGQRDQTLRFIRYVGPLHAPPRPCLRARLTDSYRH